MISQTTIDEVNEVPIEDVVRSMNLKGLKETEKSLKACCPWHDEKTPSFVVTPSMNLAKCFGCGQFAIGPVNFLVKCEKLDWKDALLRVANIANIDVVYDNGPLAQEASEVAKERIALQDALVWALDRWKPYKAKGEWSEGEFEHLNLLRAPEDWNTLSGAIKAEKRDWKPFVKLGLVKEKPKTKGEYYDVLRNRLIFPITDHKGAVIGVAGRDLGPPSKEVPKYMNPPNTALYNKSKVVYGLAWARKAIREEGEVVAVEGYKDVRALHLEGYANSVGVCGTEMTDGMLAELKKHCDRLVLMFDGEPNAHQKMKAVVPRALALGFTVMVRLLEDKHDADSLRKTDNLHLIMDASPLDAVDWMVSEYWADANSTPEQVVAASEIQSLIANISNEHLRVAYAKKHHKKCLVPQRENIEAINKLHVNLTKRGDQGQDDLQEFGFVDRYGCMHFNTLGGLEQLSNFTMRILFMIDGADPMRMLRLKNKHGFVAEVVIGIDDMISNSLFKRICESNGNFVWEGKEHHLSKIKLREFQRERRCMMVSQLGWHEDHRLYFMANGILDQGKWMPVDSYGMVTVEREGKGVEYFYIPYFSAMNRSKFGAMKNQRLFRWIDHQVEFEDWAKMIDEVYEVNGRIGLLYTLCAIFRDVHYNGVTPGWFPHLNFFGPPQTGKDTLAGSLLHLFGVPQEQISVSGTSTQKGIQRQYAQYSGALVWLNEYKNNIPFKMVEVLKSLFDGSSYTRAQKTNDFMTHATPVHCATVLSGQHRPNKDNALFSRVIFTTFVTRDFNVEAFGRLTELEKKGITSVLAQVLAQRERVEKNYLSFYENRARDLKTAFPDEKLTRVMNNWAMLLGMYDTLSPVFKFPFKDHEILTNVLEGVAHQLKQVSGSSDVSVFWELIEQAYAKSELKEERDFKIVGDYKYMPSKSFVPSSASYMPSGAKIICFRLSVFHMAYMEWHHRIYKEVGMDRGTVKSYLEDHSAFIGEHTCVVFDGVRDRAVVMAYDQLNIILDRDPNAAE